MATTTPVLGLFKPTVGADDDDWGAFWNSNADTLDAALVGGGPFLPLTGGTMQGGINVGAGATLDMGPQLFNAACRLLVQNDTYHDNVITIQNNSIDYLYNGTGTTTNGSNSVVVSSTTGVNAGRFILGPGIASGTTITAVPDGTHFTISANAGVGAGAGTVQAIGSLGNAAFRFLASTSITHPKAGYEVAAIGYSHVATQGGGFVPNTLYAEIGNLGPASDPNDTDFAVVSTHATGSLHFPATSYSAFKVNGSTGDVSINNHGGGAGIYWTEASHKTDFYSADGTTDFVVFPQSGGLPVIIGAGAGSAPDVPLWLSSHGNSGVFLVSQGQTAVEAYNPAAAVNFFLLQGAAAGGALTVGALGASADVPINITPQGAAPVYLYSRGAPSLKASNPASSVNFATVFGGAAGQPVQFGVDPLSATADCPLWLSAKGNASVFLYSQGQAALAAYNPPSSVNYFLLQGSAAGGAISISAALGASTDVSINIVPKGAGRTVITGPLATTATLTNAASDAAAASAGVAVNSFYRNGSVVMQRVV